MRTARIRCDHKATSHTECRRDPLSLMKRAMASESSRISRTLKTSPPNHIRLLARPKTNTITYEGQLRGLNTVSIPPSSTPGHTSALEQHEKSDGSGKHSHIPTPTRSSPNRIDHFASPKRKTTYDKQ